MSESAEAEPVKKPGIMLPLLIGLVLAVAGGGGAFFAVQSGLILGSQDDSHDTQAVEPAYGGDKPAFVALDPMIISINGDRHLRFATQLDVVPAYADDVALLKPRIVDVLNSYLRAVDPTDFEKPAILLTLRRQMLHRVQIVVGEGRVKDLLVMEFVLS